MGAVDRMEYECTNYNIFGTRIIYYMLKIDKLWLKKMETGKGNGSSESLLLLLVPYYYYNTTTPTTLILLLHCY